MPRNHPDHRDFPFELRKVHQQVEEILLEGGAPDGPPLVKVTVAAVIRNPLSGRPGADIAPLVAASAAVGRLLAERLVAAMGGRPVQSLGKAALIGLAGEQEHGNALLTTAFAEPLRAAIGGGNAWISSNTKRALAGAVIDVPLAHKDALYVRDNYDTVEVRIPDAPLPDEVAVIVVAANRGRVNARCGGLKAADIKGEDGLR